ncbi:MAG: hypothetical protein CMJ50_09200 [Planctomycetaceae bacterium]|jgi:hypothetical protein|nr:hypothetical protein [Planctomycetaceae bacterium]
MTAYKFWDELWPKKTPDPLDRTRSHGTIKLTHYHNPGAAKGRTVLRQVGGSCDKALLLS